MQSFLSLGLAFYLAFYVFEGVIRYGLHLIGADTLIFLRDGLLIVPLTLLFFKQFFTRSVHPAYLVFFVIIALHGLVMILNLGSVMAVVYSIKMLMTMLAGALAAPTLFKPGKGMIRLILFLWIVNWGALLLDKYYIEVPWQGLETTIGDVQVDISRDWQVVGEDKRAGGLARSSIHAATVMSLIGLFLAFHLRHWLPRLIVALATVPALVWTTQKGTILAYLLALGFIALGLRRPIPVLRLGVIIMITLCIALPLILPGYTMPQANGVFSFSSFYLRVDEMWPNAWVWIKHNEIFPFGVGLGGISGAQRMYAPNDMNAADNLFVLMYAFFGMMSYIYLGAVALIAIRTPRNGSRSAVHAMATLVFLFAYGIVISLLEDQMATLFLGGALAWLCHEIQQQRQPELETVVVRA